MRTLFSMLITMAAAATASAHTTTAAPATISAGPSLASTVQIKQPSVSTTLTTPTVKPLTATPPVITPQSKLEPVIVPRRGPAPPPRTGP